MSLDACAKYDYTFNGYNTAPVFVPNKFHTHTQISIIVHMQFVFAIPVTYVLINTFPFIVTHYVPRYINIKIYGIIHTYQE